MKIQGIAIVLMWWVLGGHVIFDAHAAEYELAMSAEKEVCQVMLQFSNQGLLGTMQLEQPQGFEAPGFNFVQWESIRLADSFRGHNGAVEGALFDINNDGQLDWVVRIQWAIGGLYSHELGIYERRQVSPFQDVGFDNRDLAKADARLTLMGRQYFLTKIPQRKAKDGRSFYYEITPAYLMPFQFKNSTYILMANPFVLPEFVADGRRFAVVAKYLSTFQLLDICYIEEARTKANAR